MNLIPDTTPATPITAILRPARVRKLNALQGRTRLDAVLMEIGTAVRCQLLSQAEDTAARGLLWSVQTGRLCMQADHYLPTLNTQAILRLVRDCAQAVTNQNDAWHWFNTRLIGMAEAAKAGR